MATEVVLVRNVNAAYEVLKARLKFHYHMEEQEKDSAETEWRKIAPRGLATLEHVDPYITEYWKPQERVLFDPRRDVNPFFHFFEALWILAGRKDVAFLDQFNTTMKNYSDDGEGFHGAYGYRLRKHFLSPNHYLNVVLDQILEAIKTLKKDPEGRQCVLSIWDPEEDMGASTKDLPCNDMIFLKVRDGALQMVVACRSNDAVWGAYGTNAVQFSMLQEFIALSVGVKIGSYVQVSDSFHIYDSNEAWQKSREFMCEDPYALGQAVTYPMMNQLAGHPSRWLNQLDLFLQMEVQQLANADNWEDTHGWDYFFTMVARPLWIAWKQWKMMKTEHAIETIKSECIAKDWGMACTRWLERRVKE